jgi:EAL domain-containing protein (putative c-di-GMP-specific phosphodiesterase class I)/GGDEF domain-containing protein
MTAPNIPSIDFVPISEFIDILGQAIEQSEPSHIVALLVVSLNRSDRIATVLYEPEAQAVSKQIIRQIRSMLRDSDRVVAISDNEIWLMLPRLQAQPLVILAANRLIATLEQAIVLDTHSVFLRPSIGIACAPYNAASATSLIRAADRAQQLARSSNLPYALSEVIGGRNSAHEDIETALKLVLANNSLTVVYQPKVNLHTGRVTSVEALVRWPADDPNPVPTVLLIDVAERAGLIDAITTKVLNSLLRERTGWLQHGIDLQVWLNLSVRSLVQRELPQLLLQALQVWNTVPASIGLEITESSLVNDIDRTTEVLLALQQAGFEMAIDDFGTGYSSLTYLRRFPISELKIDQMFVRNMVHSQPDAQIVQSIIGLAHAFNLKVVAEGAEDLQTVEALKALQCDLVQGYVYAKPMPSVELVPWIKAFHGEP